MVLGQKISDPGSAFSEIPEYLILAEIYKIFLQIFKKITNKRFSKFSNVLSSEVEGQSPPRAALAAGG